MDPGKKKGKIEARLVNRLIGTGTLSPGSDRAVRSSYHLEVFQEITVLADGSEMQGVETVSGFIDVMMHSATPETATLALHGGRQLELIILKASAWRTVEADKWTLWVTTSRDRPE